MTSQLMHAVHRLPGVLEAPAQSRRLIADQLRGHPRSDDVVLATSELVANAVTHGAATDGLTLGITDRNGVIRVWVAHAGSSFDPWVDRPFHGLGFVERLADRWGITEDEGVVTVWFEISSPDGTRHDPPETQRR